MKVDVGVESMYFQVILAAIFLMGAMGMVSCGTIDEDANEPPDTTVSEEPGERRYLLEQIDEVAVVQLFADGFEALPLREKILLWHLYGAALAGRDIFYDQRYVHNLEMREIIEEIVTHPADVDPETLAEIRRYTKLFWINTGPYNHQTARKFVLQCTPGEFSAAANAAASSGAKFQIASGETLEQMLKRFEPMFFDRDFDPIVTNKTPGENLDILQTSANNLYVDVTMDSLKGFRENYGLNSRLVADRDGKLIEEVYRLEGKYGEQIGEIIFHLEAAIPFATPTMSEALRALINYYQTGEAIDRRTYDIAWVRDKESLVDTINGFTEVYMDARGIKGSWEALVFYVNADKTLAIRTLADHAQWFEDNMPWDAKYRKEGVQGIVANAIDVVVEMGDSGPITPIGINLPNDQEIREKYGSKSISLSNVIESYERSRTGGLHTEFSWSSDEATRAENWGRLASELSTNMHEVIGHGSGKLAEDLNGDPQLILKEQYSALEEGRADLVALYFIADPKLVELGLIPKESHEAVVLAHYEGYTRNALVQLRRVREGSQLEQDHMRNRQMIIHWLTDKSDAIDIRRRDDKTYYVMTDRYAFRDGVGRLLAEVQRIKSEADYDAAKQLMETYGVGFDKKRRDEVVKRVDRLNLPSYSGFVQPKLEPVIASDGTITDVEIFYPQDLTKQMLEYSGKVLQN